MIEWLNRHQDDVHPPAEHIGTYIPAALTWFNPTSVYVLGDLTFGYGLVLLNLNGTIILHEIGHIYIYT